MKKVIIGLVIGTVVGTMFGMGLEAAGLAKAVIDDGVGFTEEDVAESKGVGIANTRGRIAAMCGGTLEVTSEPGRGTTAILHVPKTAGRY